eukprot:TRINITY_DN11249_c0_g1_i1.p1 TRINITY_DN11249_c0_g1~~TRINITY_DN11249_c0_g1_i1.p1  ORF type:complete len:606 (+),score=159.92 TRINITY_DN11249_c0_g1_i1:136-1953(+)
MILQRIDEASSAIWPNWPARSSQTSSISSSFSRPFSDVKTWHASSTPGSPQPQFVPAAIPLHPSLASSTTAARGASPDPMPYPHNTGSSAYRPAPSVPRGTTVLPPRAQSEPLQSRLNSSVAGGAAAGAQGDNSTRHGTPLPADYTPLVGLYQRRPHLFKVAPDVALTNGGPIFESPRPVSDALNRSVHSTPLTTTASSASVPISISQTDDAQQQQQQQQQLQQRRASALQADFEKSQRRASLVRSAQEDEEVRKLRAEQQQKADAERVTQERKLADAMQAHKAHIAYERHMQQLRATEQYLQQQLQQEKQHANSLNVSEASTIRNASASSPTTATASAGRSVSQMSMSSSYADAYSRPLFAAPSTVLRSASGAGGAGGVGGTSVGSPPQLRPVATSTPVLSSSTSVSTIANVSSGFAAAATRVSADVPTSVPQATADAVMSSARGRSDSVPSTPGRAQSTPRTQDYTTFSVSSSGKIVTGGTTKGKLERANRMITQLTRLHENDLFSMEKLQRENSDLRTQVKELKARLEKASAIQFAFEQTQASLGHAEALLQKQSKYIAGLKTAAENAVSVTKAVTRKPVSMTSSTAASAAKVKRRPLSSVR